MLISVFIWFICVVVINLFPVFSDADGIPRNKRSDDYVPCETGWYYFRDKCYKAGGRRAYERLEWEKALKRCKSWGGNLVSIHSQEEQDFIVSFLQLDVKFSSWTGLNDRDRESDYKWTDGSNFNYTNWNADEPSGRRHGNEDCVHLLFEPENDIVGKWNDKSCDATDAYICEMNANDRRRLPNPMYCSSDAGGGWKFGSSCYHIVNEMKSWQNAECHCKNFYKGHLVTIPDKLEDFFLDYILANMKKDLWIGIKIQEGQIQQKWTSGWYVSYDGFKAEGLNFTEGTCVAWKKRKEWITIPCSRQLSFICEVTKVSPPVLKLPPSGSHCPKELDDWRDLGGEYCYYIETGKSINFYEASLDCKRRGGDLVSLHSKEESDILMPFVRYYRETIFIGLSRHGAHEESFAWTDGSELNYENWNHNEPNNLHEKCVEVDANTMKWNDCTCESKKGYICSVKKIMSNSSVVETEISEIMSNLSVVGTEISESHVSFKTFTGVTVCILLVILLLGVVAYYFRPYVAEYRKNSTTASTASSSPSKYCPTYRPTTELTVKDDEQHYDLMT